MDEIKIGDIFYKDKITREEYFEVACWCNYHHAVIVDKGDYYEIIADTFNPKAPLTWEMNSLQDYLNSTDYCVVKCMEKGIDMDTEYPGTREKRETARNRIKEIRELLKD